MPGSCEGEEYRTKAYEEIENLAVAGINGVRKDLRKDGRGRGRFWGAGSLLQPWLSSAAALREDPAGWWRTSISRMSGRMLRCVYRLPSVPLSCIAGAVKYEKEPIRDDICMPPHSSGTHDDFAALMGIVTALRPDTVLELGTAHGNTVANICRECPEARVYTVNAPPEEISGEMTTYVLSRDEIGRVYRQYGFSERVVQIYCDTLKLNLSAFLPGPVVDLAIVDACHDPEYVVNDFLKVNPYVRRGGMVLLHDTHPSMLGHLAGSYTGCMMLRRRGFDVCHVVGTWWGIWTNTAGV
jgi:predicted O-methyltransferase YrrM